MDTSAADPFSGVFACSASGFRNVSIEWKKENGTLPAKSDISETTAVQTTSSILIIPNVTSSDVGRYYCIASSGRRKTISKLATLFFAGELFL